MAKEKAVAIEPREIKVLGNDRIRAAQKLLAMGCDRNSPTYKAMYGDLGL